MCRRMGTERLKRTTETPLRSPTRQAASVTRSRPGAATSSSQAASTRSPRRSPSSSSVAAPHRMVRRRAPPSPPPQRRPAGRRREREGGDGVETRRTRAGQGATDGGAMNWERHLIFSSLAYYCERGGSAARPRQFGKASPGGFPAYSIPDGGWSELFFFFFSFLSFYVVGW